MRDGRLRARKAWRIGTRKEADYLIMARIHDRELSALIGEFPAIIRSASGEARDPHVTLFGPFRTRKRGEILLELIRNLASGVESLSCTIGVPVALKGKRGGAVALGITPDQGLSGLYQELVDRLHPLATRCTWIDVPPGRRIFHISLRFNIPFREFEGIASYVGDLFPPFPSSPGSKAADSPHSTCLPGPGSPLMINRIALLRRGTLWKELDLPRNAWLPRNDVIDPGEWRENLRESGESDPVSPGSPNQKD